MSRALQTILGVLLLALVAWALIFESGGDSPLADEGDLPGGEGRPPAGVTASSITAPRVTSEDTARTTAPAVRGALIGIARWSDGTSVVAGRVVCRSRYPLDPMRIVTKTQGDGTFEIDDLPFGRFGIEIAHSDGIERAVQEIEHGAASSAVALTLSRGFAISGRVELAVDEGGVVPLQKGTVYAFSSDAAKRQIARARLARDGSFRIGGLRPGAFHVVIWEKKLRFARDLQVAAGTHDLVLRARKGTASVRGEVRDDRGRPFPKFQVEVRETIAGVRARRRSEEGRGGSYRISDLPAGTYELVVRASGVRAAHSPAFTVAGDGEHVFDTEFQTLTPIAGSVRDARGQPLEGADVYAFGQYEDAVVDIGLIVSPFRLEPHTVALSSARTNEDGRFKMYGLPGIRTVAVAHPEHVTLEWNAGGSLPPQLELRLTDGALVRGHLVGTLRKGRRDLVLVRAQTDWRFPSKHVESSFDGGFEFAGVGSGAWELHLIGYENSLVLRRFEVGGTAVDLGAVELDLER